MTRLVDLCLVAVIVPLGTFILADLGAVATHELSCDLADWRASEARNRALTRVMDSWKRYEACRDQVLAELETGKIDFPTACARLMLEAEDIDPSFPYAATTPGERRNLAVEFGRTLIEQSRFYRREKEGYVGLGNLDEWEAYLKTLSK